MPSPPDYIKCPQCSYKDARVSLREYRYWVDCMHCGLTTLLSNIQHMLRKQETYEKRKNREGQIEYQLRKTKTKTI